MPAITLSGDVTREGSFSYNRAVQAFRAVPGQTYLVGSCVKLASQDLQIASDAQTVIPTKNASGQQLIMGVVSDTWAGFDLAGATVAPASTARGVPYVDLVVQGYTSIGLIDQGGAGAVTITNEV